MAFPVIISIPENIARPNDGDIKHVEFYGEDETVYRFEYKKLEKTQLFEYLRRIDPLFHERLMAVSFKTPMSQAENCSFCKDVLNRTLFCEERYYRFLGHSESQIREKTCYLINDSVENIHDLLAKFGEFDQITDLGLRTRRIGVLFATFGNLLELAEDDFENKPDVKSSIFRTPFRRYTFTSGCGFMYPQFSSMLREQLTGVLYPEPSAVQVVYQGFEGMLVLKEERTNVTQKVQFHQSMQKFAIPAAMRQALSFIGIVDRSGRPYENGYLDARLIMLLVARGVSAEHLEKLQTGYLKLLKAVPKDPASARYFLRLTGQNDCTNKDLAALLRGEIDKMVDYVHDAKHESLRRRILVPKTRILVPKSRVVFGVCDPYSELKYGECYFKPTLQDDENDEFEAENKVVVACSPCFHPGDIRVLKLTHKKPRYEHLRDCLVLPVKGPRPHAFECAGSDMGGSKLFVSWDPDLIPEKNVKPCSYLPTIREMISGSHFYRKRHEGRYRSKQARREEMIEYFVSVTDDLPDLIDKTYIKFARASGSSSKQCKELSKMFYQATHLTVDKAVLRKRLVEEFEQKEPSANQSSTDQSSADQSSTERTGLLKNLDAGSISRRLGSNWCSRFRAPSSGPGEEIWDEFDKRAARFVKEVQQEHDFH